MRRNMALWGQVAVGLAMGPTLLLVWATPWPFVGFLANTAMTFFVGVALYAFAMELVTLPLGSSGLLRPIPRHWVPWALVGAVGTSSVLSGLVDRGLPGELSIRLIAILTPLATIVSGALWILERRSKPPGDSEAGEDR